MTDMNKQQPLNYRLLISVQAYKELLNFSNIDTCIFLHIMTMYEIFKSKHHAILVSTFFDHVLFIQGYCFTHVSMGRNVVKNRGKFFLYQKSFI